MFFFWEIYFSACANVSKYTAITAPFSTQWEATSLIVSRPLKVRGSWKRFETPSSPPSAGGMQECCLQSKLFLASPVPCEEAVTAQHLHMGSQKHQWVTPGVAYAICFMYSPTLQK